MGRNTNIAAGLAAAAIVACAVSENCRPTPYKDMMEAQRAGQIAPLELTDKKDRARILKALELTQAADPENPPEFSVTADDAKFPESLAEETALAIRASAFSMGTTLGAALTGVYYVPAEVTNKGEAILGFTIDGKIFVAEPFFDTSRQNDASQATALATLAACRESTTCEVYNGRSTPSLPPEAQEAARQTYETAYGIIKIPAPPEPTSKK